MPDQPYAQDDNPFPLPEGAPTCRGCGKAVPGTHERIDGEVYCPRCWSLRDGDGLCFGPVCPKCGRVLECESCSAAMGS